MRYIGNNIFSNWCGGVLLMKIKFVPGSLQLTAHIPVPLEVLRIWSRTNRNLRSRSSRIAGVHFFYFGVKFLVLFRDHCN